MTMAPSIQELPQHVVDRIAAGEVVQRPASVVKELLENSLDADSTNVRVHMAGLAKMVVSDNGKGITKEDLPLAATRFATSKLKTVDDLQSIESFGFRGEALASMSLVARLGIVSRKRGTGRAYKMEYRDGAPTNTKPTPIAGKEGTTVTVSELFYNMSHRKTMKERDEYQHVLHVVQRYAIHYASRGVGMVCSKKTRGTEVVDLNTTTLIQKLTRSDATRPVIAHVFGSQTEQHLIQLQCEKTPNESKDEEDSQHFQFKAHGYITNPSFDQSRGDLILFVNDRLVQSTALKRRIEGVYSEFAKTSKPLVYLNISVPGHHVDVNVHPTKREVALLHQDELFEELANEVRSLLARSVQTFAAGKSLLPTRKRTPAPSTETANKKRQTTMDPSRLVRTTKAAPAGALEPYLTPKQDDNDDNFSNASPDGSSSKKSPEGNHSPACEFYKNGLPDMSVPGAFAAICRCQAVDRVVIHTRRRVASVRPKRIVPTKCGYKSIQSLRSRIDRATNKDLAKELRDSTLVGVLSRRHLLVQCGEQLLLWSYHAMARELFYQLTLAQFGGLDHAMLGGGGVNVKMVLEQALQLEERLLDTTSVPDPTEILQVSDANQELAQQATACLMDNSEMLNEYFSISFERRHDVVVLTGLPVLLEGHAPQPHGLPLFLLRLATEVDWTEERPCFEGVCKELGSYYAEIPMSRNDDSSSSTRREHNDSLENRKLVDSDTANFVKHSLFPALCYLLVPPEDFKSDGTISKLALLSSLYKVFERC